MLQKMFPPEYVQGYTAALMDVRENMASPALKINLKYYKQPYNVKSMIKMLDCMIENRAILREDPDTFIRFNGQKCDFEIWKDKQRYGI